MSNTPDTTGAAQESAVILVTGATGGLGGALSRRLAADGATVVLSGRNIKKLEKLYDEIEDSGGTQPAMYPIDLAGATSEDYDQLAKTISDEFGRLDGIAHAAVDLGMSTPLDKYPQEIWNTVMQVNATSNFLLTRACLSLLMATAGSSVTFSMDQKDSAFWGAYGVSKSALMAIMRILADETEGFRDQQGNPKVAINAVHPGRMRTRLRATAFSGELPEESPLPDERVNDYLKVLLRADRKATGRLIYLDPRDKESGTAFNG